MFKIRHDNKLEQIGITSYGEGGCAVNYGVPWYIRVHKFKWGINNILQGVVAGPYHKYDGDLFVSMNEFAMAAPSTVPANVTNSTNLTNSTATGNVTMLKLDETNTTAALNSTILKNKTTNTDNSVSFNDTEHTLVNSTF